MPLPPGSRLGPYEIVAPIGAGGMGEVYRALDARLDRDVAIKILPEAFARDAERLARFEREAKTLASLNHPNIAAIYGIESAPSGRALVMELVEGEDLSQRIARGAVPVAESVAIALQIAEALDAAHERGIIHRDLKPANVKLRDDGTVKVLDFGLAKALDTAGRDVGSGSIDLMNSPTITSPATQMGMILGTAAYMSPEQARGKPVDRRADIWAFGCLLYEMLSGRRAFGGDDISLTLAAVLKEDVDFTALPADTPDSVRRMLRRCLQKDPRKRLSAIADARLDLEESSREAPAGGQATAAPSGWQRQVVWTAAGALAALAIGAAGITLWRPASPAPSIVRSEISFPATVLAISGNRSFAIDPSATEIVFVGQVSGHPDRLYRRRLAADTAEPVAGTDGAMGPSFSPDGQWLVFTQQGRLKKMPAAGGGAIDLGDVGASAGVGFLPDGSFVLNPLHGEGLFRAAATGTDRTVLTVVDHEKGEAGHHWPHVLPGGSHVLFTVELDGKPYSEARIEMLSLATGERRVLIEGGTDARYVPSGHLLYWREREVWSVPFDLRRLQVTGPAKAVLRDVMAVEPNGNAQFALAGNGTVVYLAGTDPQEERSVVLVSRTGSTRVLTTERRAFASVAVSPDGRRLAATIVAANDSLWTMDIDRAALTRITFEAENSRPVWSPDGERLAVTRYRGGEPRRLFVMPADGATAPELLRDSDGRPENSESWSRDGILAFVRIEPAGSDIWVVDVDGKREARPFLATRFNEFHPRFSPDGRWIAYVSDESGRPEVYVRPFPGPGQKRLVSSDGGTDPRWRGDGREMFYRKGNSILAVDVTPGPVVAFSLPRALFTGKDQLPSGNWTTWDVMPDGQGFLLIQDYGQRRTSVSLVQNWFEELKKK
jgi:eukaryotic-like serine/threonine-protein kinase